MVFGLYEPPEPKPINNEGVPELPPTAPPDSRFPNQNQTRYCYQGYIDFHRCKKKHNENFPACQYYKLVYETMCPMSWIEKWDTQMEEGRFPAKI